MQPKVQPAEEATPVASDAVKRGGRGCARSGDERALSSRLAAALAGAPPSEGMDPIISRDNEVSRTRRSPWPATLAVVSALIFSITLNFGGTCRSPRTRGSGASTRARRSTRTRCYWVHRSRRPWTSRSTLVTFFSCREHADRAVHVERLVKFGYARRANQRRVQACKRCIDIEHGSTRSQDGYAGVLQLKPAFLCIQRLQVLHQLWLEPNSCPRRRSDSDVYARDAEEDAR